jgi:hypothetical protein
VNWPQKASKPVALQYTGDLGLFTHRQSHAPQPAVFSIFLKNGKKMGQNSGTLDAALKP